MVDENRASANPIAKVRHLEVEEREHRRALDPDEAVYLFAAAEAGEPMTGRDRSGNVRWEMTGPARAALYRLACETELRRGAFERLEVGDIDTGPDPQVVVRGAPNTKEKRRRTIPLRRSTADMLHQYLADKLPAGKAFDMPAKWETANTLRADLEAARGAWIAEGATAEDRAKRARSDFLAPVDAEGRRLDFHALRTTCASWLDQVGVPPSVAKRVTGHSSEKILKDSYHRPTQRATRRAIDSLPLLEMRATGTDDANTDHQPKSQQRAHETVQARATRRDETDDSPQIADDRKSLPATKKREEMQRGATCCANEGDGARTRNLRIDSPEAVLT